MGTFKREAQKISEKIRILSKNDFMVNIMSEEQAVKEFIKAFVPVNKEEEHQRWFEQYMEEEHPKEDRFLLFEPSRIVGLVWAEKFNIHWKQYTLEQHPNPKEFGLMFFNKGFYSTYFIEEILNLFTNELVLEIDEITGNGDIHALMFRFFNNYAIALAERITNEYIIKDDGVVFIQTEFNNETNENEEIGRNFVKWEKDMATNVIYKDNTKFKTQIYKKEYIFKEYKDQGDFLLI